MLKVTQGFGDIIRHKNNLIAPRGFAKDDRDIQVTAEVSMEVNPKSALGLSEQKNNTSKVPGLFIWKYLVKSCGIINFSACKMFRPGDIVQWQNTAQQV